MVIFGIVSVALPFGIVFYCVREDFLKEVRYALECFCGKLRNDDVHEHIAECVNDVW